MPPAPRFPRRCGKSCPSETVFLPLLPPVLGRPFALIIGNAGLLRRAVITEVREKNVGAALGQWWLLISPLLLLAIYSVVYLVVFRVRPTRMLPVEYVLHIFSGLVPFMTMSEGITQGVGSLDANRNLLKTNAFPLEILPLITVLAALPTYFVGMGVLFAAAAVLGKLTFAILLVPLVLVLQMMFVMGVVWILSLINLVLKDVRNIVGYAMMVGMVLSPIAYAVDMVPTEFRMLVWLNPFAYFIISYQHLIVGGTLPPVDVAVLMVLASVVSFGAGHAFFSRLKLVLTNYA